MPCFKGLGCDDYAYLIICAELSRLGRNLFMIMEILNICMVRERRVWTIKDNYRLGDDIQSKVQIAKKLRVNRATIYRYLREQDNVFKQ